MPVCVSHINIHTFKLDSNMLCSLEDFSLCSSVNALVSFLAGLCDDLVVNCIPVSGEDERLEGCAAACNKSYIS